MITTFFVQARVCARLETGPLGSYLDTLITTLQTQGYAKNSIRQFLHNADAFTRWLVQQKLALADVNEAILNRYIATLRRPNSSRISGRLPKLSLGLKQVLEVLRQHGLVPPQLAPAPICRRRRSSEHMIENNAISCRRYLSLSERKCRRTFAFCRRTSAPAGDHKFLPPLFVPENG
jgi:hypothetical protein